MHNLSSTQSLNLTIATESTCPISKVPPRCGTSSPTGKRRTALWSAVRRTLGRVLFMLTMVLAFQRGPCCGSKLGQSLRQKFLQRNPLLEVAAGPACSESAARQLQNNRCTSRAFYGMTAMARLSNAPDKSCARHSGGWWQTGRSCSRSDVPYTQPGRNPSWTRWRIHSQKPVRKSLRARMSCTVA